MKLSSRVSRRLVIAIIFLAVFIFSGYGLIKVSQPIATCFDGAQNGQEEGVDCGFFTCGNYCEPTFEPPQVISTKLIKAGDKDYDFVAEIANPHKDFGASEVTYSLKLFNGDAKELPSRIGTFYLLPNQSRFLVIPYLTTDKDVLNVELKIESAKWQKVNSLEGINLIVRNQKYTVDADSGSSLFHFTVLNDTDFDFEVVDIEVLLLNSKDEIIGVNKSDIRTFIARTERSAQVVWPFPISGKVSKFKIIASTNIFENSNFIKGYGSEVEKFQRY